MVLKEMDYEDREEKRLGLLEEKRKDDEKKKEKEERDKRMSMNGDNDEYQNRNLINQNDIIKEVNEPDDDDIDGKKTKQIKSSIINQVLKLVSLFTRRKI
jgi:hypothetical protein